jgi:plastocyanin
MRRFAVIVIAAISVAGLGGSALASSPAGVPAKKKPPVKLSGKVNNRGTKSVKSGKIKVEIDDFYFKPTFIKAKAGSTVKVTLENEGDTNHTFTIGGQGVDEELSPGAKKTVEVQIPDSGASQFYCRFHKDSGMKGALFSKSGASAKSSGGSGDSSGSGGYGY